LNFDAEVASSVAYHASEGAFESVAADAYWPKKGLAMDPGSFDTKWPTAD
jgi:hypothetical protein